jgi:ArsR family transcriptional regulator
MSQTTVSQQLMRLRAEGFVTARRQGKSVAYSLSRPEVRPVIRALREAFCALPVATGPGTATHP